MGWPKGFKPSPERNAKVAAAHQARSSLTWDDVREIRRVKPQHSLMELAEIYGVAFETIGKIVRNETWKDPDYVYPPPLMTCRLRECRKRFRPYMHHTRFCGAKHQRVHWGRVHRAAERERRRRANTANRLALKSPWSLDRPVSFDSSTTLGELVTGPWEDPAEIVVLNELREALGDIDELDVESMSDVELEALRERLRAAGYDEESRAA